MYKINVPEQQFPTIQIYSVSKTLTNLTEKDSVSPINTVINVFRISIFSNLDHKGHFQNSR